MSFGEDYCEDYENVCRMDREALIESLVHFIELNKNMLFTREFLDDFPTWKLRHILIDVIEETFYPHWEKEFMKKFCKERDDEKDSKNCCFE